MLRNRSQAGLAALTVAAALGAGCGETSIATVVGVTVPDDADDAAGASDVSNEPPGEDVPDGGEDAAEAGPEAGDATPDGADVVADVAVDAAPDAASDAVLDAARDAGADGPADVLDAGADGPADVREAGADAADIPDATPPWGIEVRPRNWSCVAFPRPTAVIDTVPATIRATGCVDANNALLPAPGLLPYAPNAPAWADGADTERFMALPDGARITVGADGDWALPVGSVLVQNLSYLGRRIETRLLVRHADGDWAGYAYRWNDAQTDAALLRASDTRTLPGGLRWYYPSRADCLSCHTTAAGRTLGLETAQLNGDLLYPQTGRAANQLATLDHLGLFATPLGSPAALPRLSNPYGSGPIIERVRAYAHANCASCHRPRGTTRGAIDYRYAVLPSMWGVCYVIPAAGDLGVGGAPLLTPGDPARSVMILRMRATDANRMPPLSSGAVDGVGTGLFDAWVRMLRACP